MASPQTHAEVANPKALNKIVTVTGPIDPEVLGTTLPHEHVMSTFGAAPARYPFYDTDALLEAVLPYLEKVQGLGCRTVIDCTAAYFGRHPELLRRISRASGMQILTNTGYYGAAEDRYVPPHAYEESADEIAGRWVRECRYSIDGTEIYPGFIKTAVDPGPLSEIDRKLIVAAARTHLQTGLTIQTHTGDNPEAVQEMLALLRQEGVHPSAWTWVHAHSVPETNSLLPAATARAWISLDGVNAESANHILGLLQDLREAGRLEQALLSHDGDSYFGDGKFRPYDFILTEFIPRLRENGFSEREIAQLTVENPRQAFTVRVRREKEVG